MRNDVDSEDAVQECGRCGSLLILGRAKRRDGSDE